MILRMGISFPNISNPRPARRFREFRLFAVSVRVHGGKNKVALLHAKQRNRVDFVAESGGIISFQIQDSLVMDVHRVGMKLSAAQMSVLGLTTA